VQDLTASPLRWTVQAPHRLIPQPYFVPVRRRWSRKTHRSGVSGLADTVRASSLTIIVTMGGLFDGFRS
jgi:hypothetical protein